MKKTKQRPAPLPGPREAMRENPVVATVYFLLRFSVILVMIAQFFNKNFENVFLCVLTLILLLLPAMLERSLRIQLPDTLEIIILLFIYAAEILGEIREFYTTFQGWDTMLHTLNGFLCAAIGFSLVDLFNRNERCPMNNRLCPPATAISTALFANSWPLIYLKSAPPA